MNFTLGRPTRSWIFVPGDRQQFINKAEHLSADVIVFDLEDGVLPEGKAEARQRVALALKGEWQGPLRFVRINGYGTEWFEEDLAAVLVPGVAGICLPKSESAGMVEDLSRRLDDIEGKWRSEYEDRSFSLRILATIESAAGLLRAPAVAATSPRICGLVFGAEDFSLGLGLSPRREGEAGDFLYARSAIVVAAASANVISVDSVFPDLDDMDGLETDAQFARRLGFGGKATFNPRQLEVINRQFSPTAQEIEYAQRVVNAFENAESRGEGTIALDGQLVDLPIVNRARSMLHAVQYLHSKEP